MSICSLYLIRCSYHTYNQVDGKEDVDEKKHIRCLCHRPTVTLDRPDMKPKFRLLNSSSRLYDTVVHFKIIFKKILNPEETDKEQHYLKNINPCVVLSFSLIETCCALTDGFVRWMGAWLKCADREEDEGGAQHTYLSNILPFI